MDIWYDKIQTIKERPGLYIGKKSLILLHAYMNGYMDRQRELEGQGEGFNFEFQEYIQKRYNITSSHHWSSIITFFCTTDAEAFDRFYELLDEFNAKQDKQNGS